MPRIVRQQDWDPRQDLVRLEREMDRLTRRAFRSTARPRARVFPSIIISATDDTLVVRAEVPGMRLEDFEISVSGETLTLVGTRVTGESLVDGWYHRRERQSGGFSRAIQLPAEVDGSKAEATYLEGVLTVLLPLKKSAKPKQIPVTVVAG
jgi:HSP20 family protein